MSGSKTAQGSGKARQGQTRTYRVSPLVRAMRMTFAASLALTGSGMALAGTCTAPASSSVECTGAFTDSIAYPNVPDLTLVLGPGGVPTSVIPAAGAIGVDVTSPGAIGISSFADITTDDAAGIHTSGSDSATVLNAGHINSNNAMAIDASSAGDVSVVNTGAATAYGVYDVTAVRAETTDTGTLASIDNQATGSAKAASTYGNAIGLYGYAAAGDISINNDGGVSATSTGGLADGIFASGVNVDVTNGAAGKITATGFNWAAGIEAQSYDLTTVSNSGDISATATANDETNQIYGQAYGIFASGGASGVNATNSGHITADGVFATGVLAQGGGPVTVSNSGDIAIGNDPSLITTYYATGIQATNNYENSSIAVDNSGSIAANGEFGAKGIAAAATGIDSTVSVTNAGGISVSSSGSDYSNGTAIFASGDAGANVHNTASGTIFASGNGYAYGVQALTFNGDANVVNDGSLTASANGNAKYSAYAVGVVASSLNGNATVSNTGSISTSASSQANAASRGIYASGVGADVVNSGSIETYGGTSLGIGAVSSTGDVTVLNQGSIQVTANKYSTGTGIIGISTYGDVNLTNSSDGDIVALAVDTAYGMQGRSFYADVNLVNAGSIVTAATDPSKFFQPNSYGMYAGSRTGNVSVVNSGTILAQTDSNAFGIYAITAGDGTTTVDNSGTIQAIGQDVGVWGVYTHAVGGGDINVHNSGTIEASTHMFRAIGIWGCAGTYDYYAGGCKAAGDISVVNDGTITAYSNDVPDYASFGVSNAWAKGVWVYGANTDVANTGSISADGFALATGIEARGTDLTTVTNSGDIRVSATGNDAERRIYGQAFGIIAGGSGGDVSVNSSGAITATAPFTAIGIYATSTGGDSSVSNAGAITAASTYGLADGIFARGKYGVDVSNVAAGTITVSALNDAIGIQGNATDGDISVSNDGTVSATSTYGLADGIFATGNNVDVTTGATSSIAANGFNWAAGIEAQSYDLTTVTNAGDIHAVATANTNADPYYGTAGVYGQAYGIFASGGASGIGVTNSGAITADAVFATGVLAQGGGPVTVSNSGDITIGADPSLITTYYATGIQATNNYENSSIAVDNSGSITANGEFGAKGIAAAATGLDSVVSVTNAGGISVSSGGSDYSNGTAIFASGDAGADVHNAASGTIFASGNGYAYGVQALTFNGDANVVNDGSLTASANGNAKYSAYANGILASSLNGNATVTNTGSISTSASSQASTASRGIYASGVGADVVNSGSIETYGGTSLGIGAVGSTGDVMVLNQGSIQATANKYSSGTGIIGVSTYGDVNLTNASAGTIVAKGDFGAVGMRGTSFYANVDVVNAGSIELGALDPDASSFGQPNVYGVYAASRTGNVSVINSGTIVAQTASNIFGIYAFTTGDGTTTVDNSGTIQAIGQDVGVWGVYTGGNGGGAISVHNSGTIEATTGVRRVTGIWGCAGTYDYYAGGCTATGDISVVNNGTITTFSGNPTDESSYYAVIDSRASGIWVYGADTAVVNTGSITAEGYAWASGIEANGTGLTTVTNSGDISVSATANGSPQSNYYGTFYVDGQAFGVKAVGGADGVGVANSGAIDATAPFNAFGIYAAAVDGDASVSNKGAITATSTTAGGLANGIFASGVNIGVSTGAASNITAAALGDAFGIHGDTATGDISVSNGGKIAVTSTAGLANGIYASGVNIGLATGSSSSITATALGDAFGIHGDTATGEISVSNGGKVVVTSTAGQASGIFASGMKPGVSSAGQIDATGDSWAAGIQVVGNGQTTVANKGTIHAAVTARSGGQAFGVMASGIDGVTVSNSGTVSAVSKQAGDTAIGVLAKATGPVRVSNSGTISASQPKHAVAVSMASVAGSTLTNSGTITTTSTLEGNLAVQGSASDDAIQNFGDIHGALVLGGGNDSLLNGNRGVWDVRNHATDFGAGDDVIENAAGGTIMLTNAAIHLGSSTGVGNAFTNDGTIKATGHSLIDMGTSESAVPLAAAFTSTAVPSLNALPLTNNGVIDFRDGQPNDILTVDGDLAGSGQLDLDVSLLKHTSDLLYVNGNIVDGASQAVNVSLDGGLPTTAHTPITFAKVSGTASDDAFVKGHVTDLSPRNFLDMQVHVSRNTANAFSVDLDVAGLNDFGTLAASVGSGATSLINSQIGTWRQRMGVVPMPDGDSITVAPWVRAFSDSGDVDPRHTAANFGQSGNFGYHQSNAGQELGLNVGLQDGFSVGALLSQSEGHQRLDGMGNGSDRIKANTYGLYGTWMSPTGFYADTSLRRTDFKANLRSIGGEHRASGVGDALNVELGYTAWTSSAGVNLIPQFQYTLTSIHDIDVLHGDRFNFALQDSLSWRARLGLALSKTINAGGFVWTPYGSVNAIQEMDGQSRYQVADQFTGTTSTKGTSGMLELGLGMQRGQFSLTGGANWTDGGAQQNVLGGQVVLRYTF